jgi:hypothetical protein
VQAITSVISGGGNYQDVILGAQTNRVGKQWMGLTRRVQLAAADVNDVGSVLNR